MFTATSAATGLWEAALLNLAPERVLAIVSGAFSERWAQCARDLGLAVDVLESPWGSPVDPDAVTAALKKARYDAVTVVHSETSTGTLNDLAAIARAVRAGSEAFVLADVVTSLAGSPVECDAWGVDFALAGSQKALALPPGLGVAFASDRYRARARERSRAHYLRLSEAEAFAEKHQTPYTPSTPHLFALDVQLDHILAETVEGRWARHDAHAAARGGVGGGARPHVRPGGRRALLDRLVPEAAGGRFVRGPRREGEGDAASRSAAATASGSPRRSASATWETWTWPRSRRCCRRSTPRRETPPREPGRRRGEGLGGGPRALRAAGHEVVDLAGAPREKLLEALADADALLVRSATKVDAPSSRRRRS